MIDHEQKAITVLGDNICRTCSKEFGTGKQCVSCARFWHGHEGLFDHGKFAGLPQETIEALGKLEAYELPEGVYERLLQKPPYNKMTGKEVQERIAEFKKFIGIIVISRGKNRRIEMISEEIDEVWHTFILFTDEYHRFCQMLAGEYIHHDPNVRGDAADLSAVSNYNMQGVENFCKDYQQYFGELASAWQMSSAGGVVDESDLRKKYYRIVEAAAITIILMGNALLAYALLADLIAEKIQTLNFMIPIGAGIVAFSIVFYLRMKDAKIRKMIAIGFCATMLNLSVMALILAFSCWGFETPQPLVLLLIFGSFFSFMGLVVSSDSGKKKNGGSCGSGVGAACGSSGGGGGCGGGGCGC